MKKVEFDEVKSTKLRLERGIGFEEISTIIRRRKFVAIVAHPNKKRYPNQRMFLIDIKGYIYIVPFVEDEDKIFLKTIFPSRKHTREYTRR